MRRLISFLLVLLALVLPGCLVDSLVVKPKPPVHSYETNARGRRCHHHHYVFLQASSLENAASLDDENENEDSFATIDTVPSNTTCKRYKSLSLVYGLLAAVLLIMPDRTMTHRLASKFGGAAGFGVAAAVSKLLSSKKHQDLDWTTRQRLNWGLGGFSLLSIFAVPGEAGFLYTPQSALLLTSAMNAAKLWGALVAFAGVCKPTLRQVGNGFVATLKGMRVSSANKKRSLTYRNCLLLVLTGMLSSFLEGVFYVRYFGASLGKSLFDISLQWSAVARLFLLSSVIYSLKDLADRDEMIKGTTFLQLNLVVGAWALLVGLGQGLTMTGYTHKRGMEMIGFSLIFLTKALKYAKLRSDSNYTTTRSGLELPPSHEEHTNEDAHDMELE